MVFREFEDVPGYAIRRVFNDQEFCDYLIRVKEPRFLAIGNGESIKIREWWDNPKNSKISIENIMMSADAFYQKFLSKYNK